MDAPPAAQGRRASTVAGRKLDELCACLDDALSSRRRGPGAEARLVAEIKAKTDFLRSLLAAEAECHGGARPEHLAEAEARFAVLEATFEQWARRAVAASPEPEQQPQEVVVVAAGEHGEDQADGSGSSGSTCSCTGSCQEAAAGDAVEARKEVTGDCIASKGREAAGTRREAASDAVAKNREAMGTADDTTPNDGVGKEGDAGRDAAAETRGRTVQRCWWRRSAAWCGAAGVVAVVAVGLAAELAAVAHPNVNVYVIPT